MLLKIPLILLLLLILTSIPLSSSSYINFTTLKGHDGLQPGHDIEGSESLLCVSVPYPFGTAGNALPGFEIDCSEDPQIPSILSISKNTYAIQEISLQGYIKIIAGPIHKRCFDGENWTESEGSGQFNLDGTPFALSYQYNMLTVVGCNNLVLISGQGENLTATSGCVTFCDPQPQGTFLSGSCSGLGCCQATLPGNLKKFDLQFKQVNISDSSVASINCSAAFFSPRDDFQSGQFLFQNRHFDDSDFYNKNLIQLDWAIGNKSCEASRNNIGSFACKNNSDCYNSPSMVGYLCNCSQGYKGNPYAKDGCTDIDECHESDYNPCVGNCINLPGNYTCSCPKGMTGDGKNGGTGCKRVFPLDVALGAGLGLHYYRMALPTLWLYTDFLGFM